MPRTTSLLVQPDDPAYVSPREAARVLEVHTMDIRRLMKHGLLAEHRTEGGEARLSMQELLDARRRRDELLDDRPIAETAVAELLGTSRARVQELAKRGELRVYRVGGATRFRLNQVLHYLRFHR